MLFLKPDKYTNSSFISAIQFEMPSKKDDQVIMLFTSLRLKCDVVASDMPVVREFLVCFLRMFVTCHQSEKLR